MKSFKEHLEEGALKNLLPKKWKHAINRAVHGKKYKQALNLYHDMIKDINRNPGRYDSPGVIVANPKGVARSKAAEMLGLKPQEFAKILDRKTRYEEVELDEISKRELDNIKGIANKANADKKQQRASKKSPDLLKVVGVIDKAVKSKKELFDLKPLLQKAGFKVDSGTSPHGYVRVSTRGKDIIIFSKKYVEKGDRPELIGNYAIGYED